MKTRSITRKEEDAAAEAARTEKAANLPHLPPEVLQNIFNRFVGMIVDASKRDGTVVLNHLDPFLGCKSATLSDFIRRGLLITLKREEGLAAEFYGLSKEYRKRPDNDACVVLHGRAVMRKFLRRCRQEGKLAQESWYRWQSSHSNVQLRPPFKLEDSKICYGWSGFDHLVVIELEEKGHGGSQHDHAQGFWRRAERCRDIWKYNPDSPRLEMVEDICESVKSAKYNGWITKNQFKGRYAKSVRYRSARYDKAWFMECAGWESKRRAEEMQTCIDRLEYATPRDSQSKRKIGKLQDKYSNWLSNAGR